MLVVGVPMIIVGAINHGAGFKAMMGIGIAFTVVGFYGCPVAWVQFGAARTESQLVGAIVLEHFHTVQELAPRIGQNEKQTRAVLASCMRKGYLAGYKVEGDEIVLNENQAFERTSYTVECPRCGASYSYLKGESSKCPYCGSVVSSDRTRK